MAKKMILNRARAIPTALNRDEEKTAPSSSRNSLVSETTEQLPFRFLDEISKSFPKFHTTGRSLLINFNSPVKEQDPTTSSQGMHYCTY